MRTAVVRTIPENRKVESIARAPRRTRTHTRAQQNTKDVHVGYFRVVRADVRKYHATLHSERPRGSNLPGTLPKRVLARLHRRRQRGQPRGLRRDLRGRRVVVAVCFPLQEPPRALDEVSNQGQASDASTAI